MSEETHLSEREKEILQLVAAGLTNREIAQKLTISPNTVKVHLSNIFEKTGVASRTEATLYAIEHGIVDVPGGEAVASQPKPGLGRQVIGFWAAIGLLVVVILVMVLFNAFPSTSAAETQTSADLSERWQQLAPMPAPRQGMAVAVYGEEIYTIAGEGPEGVSGMVFRYSPEQDAWQTLQTKPTAVADVQGVLIGEKIYVPGGRDSSGAPVTALEIYDPRRDVWETGADLPAAVSAYALADLEGLLYLFGGWDGETALDTVWVYDPAADRWTQGTSLPIPCYDARAVALTDRIVVLGGRTQTRVLSDARVYFPSRDVNGEGPWEAFVDLPEGRSAFGAASIYDSVYVVGGEVSGKGESGLLITGEEWVTLPTLQDYVGCQTTVVSLDSLLFVLDSTDLQTPTEVWAYQAFYYSIYIPFVP